jgi:hypothetical protein
MPGGNVLTVPYTVQRDEIYADMTVNTRFDSYLMSSLSGLDMLVDCMDFFMISLDLNFEDGWESVWEI